MRLDKLDTILDSFQESDHPRDESGQFKSGGSGGYSSETSGRTGEREYESGYGSKPQPKPGLSYYGWSSGTSSKVDACLAAAGVPRNDAQWDESKHPRGQPGNAGQFGPGGGGAKKSEPPPKEEKPAAEPTRSKTSRAAVALREEQAEAAKSVKSYLGMVQQMMSRPSPQLAHGKQFFANGDTYKGRRMTQHQCYRNAALKAIENNDLTYVEGYVTVHGVPIEHAWVVDKAGNVIDPTIKDPKGIGGYFGVPFQQKYLERTLLKNKVYGMFGMFNPSIYEAKASEYVAPHEGGTEVEGSSAQRIAAGHAPATSLLEQHHVPSVEDFVNSIEPEIRKVLDDYQAKLANENPTDSLVSKGGHKQPDGQWTPERQQLHSKIIRELLSSEKVKAARPKAGEQPTFTILGGRAGSGKSWATKPGEGPIDTSKNIVIDSDEVKKRLPEYKGYNAGMLHEEASDVVERMISMARQMKLNVVLDGTMKSMAPAQEKLQLFKDAGYKLEGYYIFAPPAVAARRAVHRSLPKNGEPGRYVPPSYVLGSLSNERSFDGLREYFDKWQVYENAGELAVGKPQLKFYGGPDTDIRNQMRQVAEKRKKHDSRLDRAVKASRWLKVPAHV